MNNIINISATTVGSKLTRQILPRLRAGYLIIKSPVSLPQPRDRTDFVSVILCFTYSVFSFYQSIEK